MAHAGGRPLKFESVEELQEKIDNYFNTTPKEEWTMTGLCIDCDMDYQTLINYSEKEQFFEPIKKARLKVHNQYEISLRKNGRSGDIFALKNFGWTDKTEVDTNIGNKDNKPFELSNLSVEEIKELLKNEHK